MNLWLLVVLLFQLTSISFGTRCLNNPTDADRLSYSSYRGKPLVLTIESSGRVTHNVTSHIYAILLKEKLGYLENHIEIKYENEHDARGALYRIAEDDENTDLTPETLINLEVWADPYFRVVRRHKVYEVGPITNPGRFGWFARDKEDVTWKRFETPDGSFALSPADMAKVMSYVRDDKCVNSTENTYKEYIPEKCASATCATILAANYNETKTIIKHITSQGLYVRVVWLGKCLQTALDNLPSTAPLLVITWFPGEVTFSGHWFPVAFPPCMTNDDAAGCMYESWRIVKLVSGRVRGAAEKAYSVASDIIFSRTDYLDWLNLAKTNPNLSHYDMACDWLKNNQKTWQQWLPPGSSKPKLTICGIFPFSQSLFSPVELKVAARMAIDAVNRNTNVLPYHDLELSVHDGACKSDQVTNTFINYVINNNAKDLVGILGPACSDTVEPLVGITKYFRTVVISYSAEGSIFSDREKYPFFFRTIGENQQFKHVYLKLMEKLKWKRIAALTEDGQKYTEYLSYLHDLLQSRNLSFVTHRKFPRDRANVTMKTYLDDLMERRARIIVADVQEPAARAVMCQAYRMKMTSKHGYVWFLPGWLDESWYDTDALRKNKTVQVDCTTQEMKEAIQGYFSLAHQYYAPADEMTHENITVKTWKEKFTTLLNHSIHSHFSGFAYDAIWTYALALDKLHRTNDSYLADVHADVAAHKFVEIIEKTNFVGVSGRIQFLSGPSRITNVNILQWVDGAFNEIGVMKPIITNRSEVDDYDFTLREGAIQWFTANHMQPEDGEEFSHCVIQGLADLLNLDCGGAIIVANVIGFGLLAVLLVIAFVFTKYRYDKRMEQLELTEKFMKGRGFDQLPNLTDLDKWELPRDCVVINRKLGEGAFGTVYGGEAYFDGEGWIASAVKTLKLNSTTEQKLDFLSEAEVMKRFDHKNIVKLLGVCTRDEPVYTVMEFMLYGDLKTFLLNRRHLVTSRRVPDESNEVSNKKLTTMALDIARGLSYLASLKYIHRDMACRNCLLNSSRVAKIGDFGLTRRMYENDYYKFSRKGMLPIRWMAPESLVDGVFTTKSDVWSFGVVLFEIVTFGSYPFQGLSNNEVMDYIKEGNTIQLPKNIKPQLECLIKSTWNLDYRKRPEVSEIVAFLASNPRLLSPCLDTPSSSAMVDEDLDARPSVPVSPFDPNPTFFPGEPLELGDRVSPPASPTESFPDNQRELLLPSSKPILIPMTQMAPLASRTPSDIDLQIGLL